VQLVGFAGNMSSSDTVHLDERECWRLLERHVVARLAVDVGGRPDIFPINYVVDGNSIVFRTGAGTKLAGAVLARHVAVEIDGLEVDGSVWSVVVKGVAHEVTDMEERFAMDDLPLYPWIASEKPDFVRIEPTLTTGRRFHIVERELPNSSGGRDREYHPGAPRLRPD
jgi:uncharacterized protein